MDFISKLPCSQHFDVILVVVDRLSKACYFIGLTHPLTSKIVADAMNEEVVRLHGIPRSNVTGRDPIFCGSFWKELFKATGTRLRMSSSYHSKFDGQTEVMNRCLEVYLCCSTSEFPHHWAHGFLRLIIVLTLAFVLPRGVPHSRLCTGDPPTITQFLPREICVKAIEDELLSRDSILKQLWFYLEMAQQRIQHQANKYRREVEYEVGDRVFLKFRPYR